MQNYNPALWSNQHVHRHRPSYKEAICKDAQCASQSLCWDRQMKSFIVDFKMDSELNSMSQNSPFFTPRCKIQIWAILSGWQNPHWSGSQNPRAFIVRSLTQRPLLLLRIFKGSYPPPPTVLPAFKIPSSGPNKLWRTTSCIGSRPKELLLAAATWGPANLRIWGTPSRLAPSCYPCKGKEQPVSSSANFHQTLHSKNSIQHWNPSCNHQHLIFKDW